MAQKSPKACLFNRGPAAPGRLPFYLLNTVAISPFWTHVNNLFEQTPCVDGQDTVRNEKAFQPPLFPCMSHCPAFGNHLTSLGHAVFRDNRVDGICAEKTLSAALHFSVAPSQRSSPQAISTASCPSTLHSRSLPPELCPSCFQRFPVCSRCILAPSQQSFSQAISNGFQLAICRRSLSLSLCNFARCPVRPRFGLAPLAAKQTKLNENPPDASEVLLGITVNLV